MSEHVRAELTGNHDLDRVILAYDLSEHELERVLQARPMSKRALESVAEGVSRARREVYIPVRSERTNERLLPSWLTVGQ